jgi:hypothetical protein
MTDEQSPLVVENEPNSFEMSLRVFGNELVGIRIAADNFQGKWLILSIIGIVSILSVVSIFSNDIKDIVTNDNTSQTVIEETAE